MKTKLLIVFALTLVTSTATLLAQNTQPVEENTTETARKAARKEIRTTLKAYRKEVIRPEMRKARQTLETSIAAADRKELDRLRRVMKTRPKWDRKAKAADKAARKAAKADFRTKVEAWRKDNATDLERLDQLSEKYSREIAQAQRSLDEKRPEWEAYRKSVIEQHRDELGDKARKGEKRHHRRPMHVDAANGETPSSEEMKAHRRNTRFLLMSPDAKPKPDRN